MRISGINPQLSQLSQLGQTQPGSVGHVTDQTFAKLGSPGLSPDKTGEDFGQMLKDALAEVNGVQADSRQMQNDYLAGKPVEFHDLMITMEKASTAMSLTLQVRNKLLDAFQEIQRTQV